MVIKLALFDLDGTIVTYEQGDFQSSWDAIGKAALHDNPKEMQAWEDNVDYYVPRLELYHDWVDSNCKSLEGIVVEKVFSKIFPPPYVAGLDNYFKYMGQKDVKTGILSSGVDFVAEYVQKEFGLDFYKSNEVHIADGKFVGTGKVNVHLLEKGKVLKSLLDKYDVDRDEVMFVGDNSNDISAWKEVGLPIGMNLKSNEYDQYVENKFTDFNQLQDYIKKLF